MVTSLLALGMIALGFAVLLLVYRNDRKPAPLPLAAFLESVCETGSVRDYSVFAGDLYAAYQRWCGAFCIAALDEPQFRVELWKAGYTRHEIRLNGEPLYAWLGLRLKQVRAGDLV